MDDTFDYGLAINFLGNYRREGKAAQDAVGGIDKLLSGFAKRTNREMGGAERGVMGFLRRTTQLNNSISTAGIDRLNSALSTLKGLVVGGVIAAGFNALKNKVMDTGQNLERMYASLDTVFHDENRVRGLLDWASKKAVDTPFEMLEVSDAVTKLAQMGKAKNNKMLDENFTYMGDFAASKGIGIGDAVDMVSKASFGNWERLGDNYGIRLKTLMSIANNAVGPHRAELIKLAGALQTAKAGTNAYSASVVKFLGLYSEGGMAKRVHTVAGAISNIEDLVNNFFVHMVGLSQVEGTLFNGIGKSLNDFLGIFDRVTATKVYTEKDHQLLKTYNGELSKTNKLTLQKLGYDVQDVTVKDHLFSLAERAGSILLYLFQGVAGRIQGVANSFADWIVKLDAWSHDFPGKVAPLIVFLTLLKFKVQDMWHEFVDGFNEGLGPAKTFFGVLFDIVKQFDGPGKSTAHTIGKILGYLISMKAIGVIASPFTSVIGGAWKLFDAIRSVMGLEKAGMGGLAKKAAPVGAAAGVAVAGGFLGKWWGEWDHDHPDWMWGSKASAAAVKARDGKENLARIAYARKYGVPQDRALDFMSALGNQRGYDPIAPRGFAPFGDMFRSQRSLDEEAEKLAQDYRPAGKVVRGLQMGLPRNAPMAPASVSNLTVQNLTLMAPANGKGGLDMDEVRRQLLEEEAKAKHRKGEKSTSELSHR